MLAAGSVFLRWYGPGGTTRYMLGVETTQKVENCLSVCRHEYVHVRVNIPIVHLAGQGQCPCQGLVRMNCQLCRSFRFCGPRREVLT